MAVLEKIRVQMGIFITVLIAIALLSFIIDPNTLQSALSMFSSKNDVGKMDGSAISYMEYSKKLEYYTNLQQALSGSSSLDEQSQEMAEQSAWQDFLKEKIYYPAFEKAGVALGTEELLDMTQGNDLSPLIAQDAVFLGEDGLFDRARLVQFVQSVTADPDGIPAMYWTYLQENMKMERTFAKYSAMLAKSNVVTPVELRRNMEENNQTANVRFSVTPISFNRDTTIVVTDAEIKAYYDAHSDQYEQAATRDLEYVVFPIVPSLDDINQAEADIEKVFEEFSTTDNVRQFLARNSDKPLDVYFYKEGELSSQSPVLDSFAFAATTKDVLPIFQDENTFRAARIAAVKDVPDSVYVHHILLQGTSAEESKKLADSLMTILKKNPERFAELATEFSADQNPNLAPGEIGWFTQQYMIAGLESTLDAKPNEIFELETQYGLHLVKVTERTKPLKKVQLAVLVKEAVAGKETYQDIYSQANTLSTKSKTHAEFNQVASENNWYPIPAVGIAEGAKDVSGYQHMREMVRWAFEAKYNEVSPVFSVDNAYFFVATLTGIHEAGTPTLAEKRSEIESQITVDKKMDRLFEEIKTSMTGYTDIDAWSTATGKTLTSQQGMAFATTQQTDPVFAGAVVVAPDKQMCGPVKGQIGVYVFQVDERVDGAYYTELDAKQRASYAASVQSQMVPVVLQDAAKVIDNRAKFF